MVRVIRMYFAGPAWMSPQIDPDLMMAYSATPYPIECPETGYPPIRVTGRREDEAVIELNSKLSQQFPDDTILVLVAPLYPDFQTLWPLLQYIYRVVWMYLRRQYL